MTTDEQLPLFPDVVEELRAERRRIVAELLALMDTEKEDHHDRRS